jgi:hypothetical protein
MRNHSRPKRLDEMDDLRDMGRFPVVVYIGATGNILFAIRLTFLVHARYAQAWVMLAWAAGLAAGNVLPVVFLRWRMRPDALYPIIEEMGFFGDQHKFATGVYAVAVANMFFWIVLAWTAFTVSRALWVLAAVLPLAFVSTFFPAWVRLFARPAVR